MRVYFVIICYFFLQKSEGLPVHTYTFNVTLYSERNSTGESNNFSGTSCQNLPYDHFNVSAVNTYGDCVRLYSKSKCQGRSIALHHHHSSPSAELQTFLNLETRNFKGVTKSISPCFEGLEKEVWIGPIPGKNVNVDSNVDSSIYNYQQGFENRIEYVHAIVYNQDINMKIIKFSSVGENVNRLNTDPTNYEISPIIPLRLGGPSLGAHNFFPKVKNLEKNPSWVWKVNQENQIFNILKDDIGMKFGEIFINFIYTTEHSTIPLAFICRFVQPNGEIMIREVINTV